MSCPSRASSVAALSVGAVEALKDQAGLCRWNYALRSLQHHARTSLRSLSQAMTRRTSSPSAASSSSSSIDAKRIVGIDEKMRQSEESLRKVMFLSTWGPN